MKKAIEVTRSSGNIFADLGLPRADDHLRKAEVVAAIARSIKARKLTQREAAARIGLAQPDVSTLLRGRYEGFSLDRLLGFLLALGHDLDIVIKPANDRDEPGLFRLVPATA